MSTPEELGELLAEIDPEGLKLLAVVRHAMAEHEIDLVAAIGMFDDVDLPKTVRAVWETSSALAHLALAHAEPNVLHVESVVSIFTGAPRVGITWKEEAGAEVKGSFSPAAARHHAQSVLEAAEAAEHDAALHAAMREKGAAREEAAAMVASMREFRSRYRREQGEPETFRDPEDAAVERRERRVTALRAALEATESRSPEVAAEALADAIERADRWSP